MFAVGSAVFGDVQYAIAIPRATNGSPPSRRAAPSPNHSPAASFAVVVTRATRTIPPAAAVANASAAKVRPASRTAGDAGSVRRKDAHGVTRSIAAETPNW